MKTVTRYEIREFPGLSYSKRLGRRLRTRPEATRALRLLRKLGRTECYAAAIKVAI